MTALAYTLSYYLNTLQAKVIWLFSPNLEGQQALVCRTILLGEYGKIVPQSQSRKMNSKMKSADKDVTYLGLRYGDHGLLPPFSYPVAVE